MKHSFLSALFVFLLFACFVTGEAFAASIGKVVALRGSSTVERGGNFLDAKVNLDIEASDIVKTSAGSKVKLLFVDGSILTLGEKTHLIVKEFIDGKGERGKSIFNLLDGKMRSVVGHTKFEVETPTAVAAARGTVIYFDVRALQTRPETTIVCLEGVVDVTSLLADVPGASVLTAGNMVIIRTGEPFVPVPAPPALLDAAGGGLSSGDGVNGGGVDPGGNGDLPGGGGGDLIPVIPPLNQEPIQPSKVDIIIEIPM